MTICEAPPESLPPAATWGWAVVEIRRDETWGRPVVIPAGGATEAIGTLAATSEATPGDLSELTPVIQAHLGALHVVNGDLHQAVITLSRGARAAASTRARADCLARQAHVEAILGDLRAASHHAAQVHSLTRGMTGAGGPHSHLAKAWVALEQADVTEVRRHLDLADDASADDVDPWVHTSRLLVEAGLLIATGEPDEATRLLAARASLVSSDAEGTWLAEVVEVQRARALLAAGEPQRALAVVTPMPARAGVQAAVVAAAARHSIGDHRGAQAVLAQAVVELERAPLGLQIEAWLLEARLAETVGKHDRARLLTDRALRLATAQRMRRPLVRDRRWLRSFVDRDAELLRTHREFLSTCQGQAQGSGPTRPALAASGPPLVAPLTEREGQVLDLLAQMYSTEEIAASLYVSSNTVKTHLKGIFGKLCVNRRVEAVRRGRVLGLC